jgi:hypothetical protein
MDLDLQLMLVVAAFPHPGEQSIGGRPRNARNAHGRRTHNRTHEAHHHHVHLLIVASDGARQQKNDAFSATSGDREDATMPAGHHRGAYLDSPTKRTALS